MVCQLPEVTGTQEAKIRHVNLNRRTAKCPRCGGVSKRHSTYYRTINEIGVSHPVVLDVFYSKHYCAHCRKHHLSNPMMNMAPSHSKTTYKVRSTAIDLVLRQSMTLEAASLRMQKKYHVRVPINTLSDWIKQLKVLACKEVQEKCHTITKAQESILAEYKVSVSPKIISEWVSLAA